MAGVTVRDMAMNGVKDPASAGKVRAMTGAIIRDQGISAGKEEISAGRRGINAGMVVRVVAMAAINAGNGRFSLSTQVTRWRQRSSVLNESNVSPSRWPKDRKQPPNGRSPSRANRKSNVMNQKAGAPRRK